MSSKSELHEKYMEHALNLAKKGLGSVSPNPAVGSVIVRENKIIAEGFHTAFGKAHAEVEALKNLELSGYIAEPSDTMYVTLEPCNHYGKTPPCTEAIIHAGIKNLVVAMQDPNPLVAGNGIQRLKQAGVSVTTGVLEDQAKHINRAFIKNIISNKPFVRAKWAMTLDGKMATDTGDSKWISGESSRKLVHKWRLESDAVLIGSGTANKDNPKLNLRFVKGVNPYRLILDSQARLPIDSNLVVCDDPHKTVLITTDLAPQSKVRSLKNAGIQVIEVNRVGQHIDLNSAFEALAPLKIASIFSEAGPKLSGALLQAGLIDEVAAFISPKLSGGSLFSPFNSFKIDAMENAVALENIQIQMVDQDVLIEASVRR